MPRKYTKKKGRKKKTMVKRGGTLTKTFEPEPEPEQYDIQEPELQPFDELPEQSEFFSKLDSQIPEKIGQMTYDEFVQDIKNKDLYGCFNIISHDALISIFGVKKISSIFNDFNNDKWWRCYNKFTKNNPAFGWYVDTFEQNGYIHIDDFYDLMELETPKQSKDMLSKIYEKLPEYREENLREAYNYYIKHNEQQSKQYEQNSAINQKSFAQTLAQKSKGLIEPQLHKLLYKYPFDTYLTQTWTDMWADILMDPYIEFIIDKMYQGKEVDDITKQNMISTIKKMLEDSKSDFFISKIPPFDMNTYLELLKLHQ